LQAGSTRKINIKQSLRIWVPVKIIVPPEFSKGENHYFGLITNYCFQNQLDLPAVHINNNPFGNSLKNTKQNLQGSLWGF